MKRIERTETQIRGEIYFSPDAIGYINNNKGTLNKISNLIKPLNGVLLNWSSEYMVFLTPTFSDFQLICKEINNFFGEVKTASNLDPVNHPLHYGGKDDVYEVIKVIEAWGLGFHLGNTVKYVARAGKKDKAKHLEDLKKAQFYLSRKIKNLEKEK